MRKAGFILSLILLGSVAVALPTGMPVVQNGDVNADGRVNSVDAIYLLGYLYNGGPAPTPLTCGTFSFVENGDVNGDGTVCLTDVVCLLTWIHQGGPAPIDGCAMLQS